MRIITRLFQLIQALILVGLVCAPVNATPKYKFTPLDAPAYTDTKLIGINDYGQISGICGFNSQGTWHGVLYSQGEFYTFDVPGAISTYGGGIDALGRIAGYFSNATGFHGFQYDRSNLLNPFIYPLDANGASGTYAIGINSSSTIAGYFTISGGQSISFSYAGGNWQTFSVSGATATRAVGINEAGEILGFYGNPPGSLVEHGFIRSDGGPDGTYTFIDNPQADGTILYGKNALNQIVGACRDSNGKYHGFLYDGNTFATIEPPGAIQSWAKGINRRGQIVGQYIDQSDIYHGFLANPINGLTAVYQLLLLD